MTPEAARLRWRELAERLGAAPGAAKAAGARLTAAYAAPARAYHGLAHIGAMLDRGAVWADRLAAPDRFALAVWFHDVVCDGAPGRDEAASAEALERFAAEAGLAREIWAGAAAMVRATAGHRADPGWEEALARDGAAFLDADLEILAAPGAAYDAYAAAIRREYARAPEPLYRAGRAAALRGFLERPRIYVSAAAPEAWEATARANLAREIAALAA